jgi:predicted transposase YdaD
MQGTSRKSELTRRRGSEQHEIEQAGVNPPSLIDRTLKALIRRVPAAFFRLVGAVVDPAAISPEDVTVILPEYRADHVLKVGGEDDPGRWALHVEFQLEPDARVLRGWFLKNAALTAQLDRPVILAAIYLTRGNYATFPVAYAAEAGGLSNQYSFPGIRLWEHAARIRNGELRELAPLLVLCEDTPGEDVLREERALILGLDAPQPLRSELLALAITVGTRYFARELLQTLFREELQMLKEASFVEEWLNDALEQGLQRGLQQGEDRGRSTEARQMLLTILRERFGELPAAVIERIEREGPEWCRSMVARAVKIDSLDDLDLESPGAPSP